MSFYHFYVVSSSSTVTKKTFEIVFQIKTFFVGQEQKQ